MALCVCIKWGAKIQNWVTKTMYVLLHVCTYFYLLMPVCEYFHNLVCCSLIDRRCHACTTACQTKLWWVVLFCLGEHVMYRVARFFFTQYTYQNRKNVPNEHKMYQMVIKYPKWPWNISTFSNLWPSKIYPNWDFGFENKPSGNPGYVSSQTSLALSYFNACTKTFDALRSSHKKVHQSEFGF
jgi:hypothetical protein